MGEGFLHRLVGTRSEQAALFVAAGAAPLTFQRTLRPRTTVDQGVITGISTALNAVMAELFQESIEVIALGIAGAESAHNNDLLWRRTSLAVDLAAIGFGFAVQAQFSHRPNESLWRAASRSLGYWLSTGGFAGAAVGATHELSDFAATKFPEMERFATIPSVLPASAVVMTAAEVTRRVREWKNPETGGVLPERFEVAASKALATSAGVYGGLAAVTAVERLVAGSIKTFGRRAFPDVPHSVWTLAGRAVAFGLLTGVLVGGLEFVNKKLERSNAVLEPAFSEATSTYVSGGPGSLVPFDSLGRWGRRNIGTVLTRNDIATVMGEPAISDPIRVYVGLDSAPTEEERVDLAIRELDRTGAFDRSVICLVSPTGTGYINYVFADAFEYLTRGDCALVGIQYSKRPSPLSLDRVWQGRRHFRLLAEAVHDRILARPPGQRPRVVAFGESLGAHTSQDAFVHQGTDGLAHLGIERALWIGTPYASKWKQQVLHQVRPDTDPSKVIVVSGPTAWKALAPGRRQAVHYVMVSHDDDAVTKFGVDLLVQAPEWLGDPVDSRPAGVPRSQRWATPTTFVETAIDMKNAMDVVPGRFAGSGHDYRSDLGLFTQAAFALPATAEQMERMESALRRNELIRAVKFKETTAPDGSDADTDSGSSANANAETSAGGAGA